MADPTPEQQQQALRLAVQEMFGNVSEYVQGELEGSSLSWQCKRGCSVQPGLSAAGADEPQRG